jgi:mRNA-degrading endonuclease RelE of RelBE toxin-antitoxin system
MRSSHNPDERDAAAFITAFLQEAKNNQTILDKLSVHRHQDNSIDVQRFQTYWQKGKNLWRLKLVSLMDFGLPYRIIYAFDHRIKTYFILGIVNRDFEYDEKDPRTQRIISIYDKLGVPSY